MLIKVIMNIVLKFVLIINTDKITRRFPLVANRQKAQKLFSELTPVTCGEWSSCSAKPRTKVSNRDLSRRLYRYLKSHRRASSHNVIFLRVKNKVLIKVNMSIINSPKNNKNCYS